jgi:hypothetical protein
MRYDMSNGFLPISKQDMIDEGIEQLDFVYVCGDAYVDHPSFGHAIIARLLQAQRTKRKQSETSTRRKDRYIR